MIKRDKNANGQLRFKGSAQDLHHVNDWVRSFLHVALGEEKGEERYRNTRLIDALDLWTVTKVDE